MSSLTHPQLATIYQSDPVLFLTSLSLPIIKGIYLMKASFTLADGSKGDIRFGVWGECVYGVDPKQLGFTGVTFFGGQCTHKGLGPTTRTVCVLFFSF